MDTKNNEVSKLSRRQFVAGAAVAGAALAGSTALAGCDDTGSTERPGGSGGGADGKSGGTLKYYVNEPSYIDPFNLEESEGTAISSNIFDSLLDYDFKAEKLIPAAAESWEVNDDATVFTFKLVSGAKFHNGDAVTAKDFKYGWERIVSPKTTDDPSTINYHLAMVKGFDVLAAGTASELSGVKAIDDLTLEVTLSQPYADFLFVVTHPALGPVPSGGAAKDFKTFSQAPIGNGPFKIKGKWEHDQYIQVERFDDYYGQKPYLDAVDFIIKSDPNEAFRDFESGDLDFTQIAEGKIQSTLAAYGESKDGWTINPGQQGLTGTEFSIYYLFLNVKDVVLKDINIRKAISYAINRQAICDAIFEGTRGPADGIVPPGINGFKQGAWPHSVYSVEKAKQALVDGGYPGGAGVPTLKLSCNSGGGHENIMQMIQADLAAVGIAAELDTMEWASYLEAAASGSLQMGRLGWIADYPIMDNFVYSLFTTDAGDNRSQYSNKTVDDMLLEARTIVDEDERLKKFQEADALIAADVPAVPLMVYKHHHVGSKRVNDFFYAPDLKADLRRVWLTK
jgi:peptide/nickel transport system substrate-binding protein/oligopeptide transport system substrate-binding protein